MVPIVRMTLGEVFFECWKFVAPKLRSAWSLRQNQLCIITQSQLWNKQNCLFLVLFKFSLAILPFLDMIQWNLCQVQERNSIFHRCVTQCCGESPAKFYDVVIKWKHFPRYWPFVRGIHRSPVISPHKGQWRGALMFSLICAWINARVNNHGAGGETPSRALWRRCNVESICSTYFTISRAPFANMV